LAEGDGDEDAAEFGRLNLDKAEVDPAAGVVVDLAEQDDVDEG
jgi:hypothetical protein